MEIFNLFFKKNHKKLKHAPKKGKLVISIPIFDIYLKFEKRSEELNNDSELNSHVQETGITRIVDENGNVDVFVNQTKDPKIYNYISNILMEEAVRMVQEIIGNEKFTILIETNKKAKNVKEWLNEPEEQMGANWVFGIYGYCFINLYQKLSKLEDEATISKICSDLEKCFLGKKLKNHKWIVNI